MEELYDMIFKRKSVRRFDKELTVSEEELQKIKGKMERLVPLVKILV
jgi:nitroreductase